MVKTVFVRIAVVCLMIAGIAPRVFAADTVTLSLSGNSESFNLVAGNASNSGSSNITATTTWSLLPPCTASVYAYFASASTALTDGAGHNIPSSAFDISDNGGASAALTNTIVFGGANAGLQLENLNVGPANKNSSVTDAMTFNINLSGLPQLPAGTYTGSLFMQSQGACNGNNNITNSGAQTIAVTATLPESLTISLSSHAVTFSLKAGSATNAGSTSITASSAWVMKPSRTAVGLYAYFSSAPAALTDGFGDNIPSSAFFISNNGGASTALTTTVAFGAASAGLRLANVAITSANENSSRTDAMAFNINLSGGTLPQLPAGTYTGTLNIQAQATP